MLRLAVGLFEVTGAALVIAGADGLTVETVPEAGGLDIDAARAAACRLFEVLAAAPAGGGPAGVMEELVPGRGFLAVTPILSDDRCLGAICLMDAGRRVLLSGLQRRLFAEFGDLVAPTLTVMVPPADAARDPAAVLQGLAEAEADAFALFDAEGVCLLRNARFDALLGTASAAAATAPAEARGREASWLALHLARDLPPVGVYRAAMSDGTWLSVEERRGPRGRSLVARVEAQERAA